VFSENQRSRRGKRRTLANRGVPSGMLLLLVYVDRVGKSLAFLPPPMVEGHVGRMMVADTWHLAESDTHIIRLLGLPSPKCLEEMNFRKSA
jgi:hypothetical protein